MALDPCSCTRTEWCPQHREFYADRPVRSLGDPAADPVLTVRMQPPDSWERRMDLATRRAVKVDESDVCPWVCTATGHDEATWLDHHDVADWPYVEHVDIGAAQRLAHPEYFRPDAPAAQLPSDEEQ